MTTHSAAATSLLDATLALLARDPMASIGVADVAREAGVERSLVIDLFGSMDELLVEAAAHSGARHAAQWKGRLEGVESLPALVEVARQLHQEGESLAHAGLLAQFLAASTTRPALARATGLALDRWVDLLEPVVARVLDGTVLGELLDAHALAGVIADAFVGVELASVTRDETESERRFALLQDLAGIVDVVLELGPVAARVVRHQLARAEQVESPAG